MAARDFPDFDRIDRVVRRALDRPPSEREAFIARTCGADVELCERVARVLDLATEDAPDLAPGAGFRALEDLDLDQRGGADLTGARLGPWRVLDEIGRGGMAIVFRAERADGAYRQQVAVKLLRRTLSVSAAEDRFEQERRVLARLEHPSIARLIDGGTTTDGLPYIVMEYVNGEPIHRYCDQRKLSIEARLDLFLQVCEAVQFAHRQLIVHRDIKPANILVTPDGTPKLLDFGIAKLLESDGDSADMTTTLLTHRMLTPQYASPEQILGEPVSTATDVYALGLLLYELLCGHRARVIDGQRPTALERSVRETRPTSPSLACASDRNTGGTGDRPSAEQIAAARGTTPARLYRRLRGDLDNVVMMALRREPQRRYATAQQLADDTVCFLGLRPVKARPDSLLYRLNRYLRRHIVGVSATTAALAAVALTVVYYTAELAAERDAARDAAERARVESAKVEQVSNFMTGLFEASRPDESLGREQSARDLLDRGLERIEELDDEPEVQARVLSVIGKTLHRLGDYPGAEALYRRVLDIRQELFGAKHLQIAESLNDLGVALKDRGRLESAGQILSRAVEMRRALPQSPEEDLAISVEELGRLLREQGRLLDAKALFEEGLAIRRRVYGEAHSETLSSLNSVAMMYRDLGDPVTALERFGELVDGYRKVKGERHPWTAISMGNMAGALTDLERWDEAEALLQDALSIERETLGADHVSTAITLNKLGTVHRELGRLEASINDLQEAVRIGRSGWGEQHPRLATFLLNLGRTELARGEFAAATKSLEKSVAMHRSFFDEADWRTAEAIGWLGELKARTGQLDEAESLMLASHAALLRAKGADAAPTREARERMLRLYAAQGEDAKASRFRARLEPSPDS